MIAASASGTLEQALAQAEHLLQRDPALAVEQLDEILQVVGAHPLALQLLAAARLRQGDAQAALDILLPLAPSQPTWAALQLDLGVVLGRLGRGEEAIAALRRAVALKPDLPQAWRELGDHLMAAGEQDAADAAYARHVLHSTHDPRLMGAAVALAEGRIPQAEALLREHLKQAPTDVAAIRMFAEVAARVGRNEDALNLLARCLELAPGFDAARQHYAMVLHRSNQPERSTCALQCWPSRSPSALTSAGMPGRIAPTKLSLSSARTMRGRSGSRVNSAPEVGDTLAPGCAATRTTWASNGARKLPCFPS